MASYEECLTEAQRCIGDVVMCQEYADYYVFSKDEKLNALAQGRTVAVDKRERRGYFLLAVANNLGTKLREFDV